MKKYLDDVKNAYKPIRNRLEEMLIDEDPTIHWDSYCDVFPILKKTIRFNQCNPHHDLTLDGHIKHAMKNSPRVLSVRMAMMFHDVGKVFAKNIGDNGVAHFKQHDKFSNELAKIELTRLGYSDEFVKEVCELIHYHMWRYSKFGIKGVRKMCNKFDDRFLDKLFTVWIADSMGRINYEDSLIKSNNAIDTFKTLRKSL